MHDVQPISRSVWEAMTSSEQDMFIHEHVMSEEGEAPAYTTDYYAVQRLVRKYQLMYSLEAYAVQEAAPTRTWQCRAEPRVESLQGSYTWAAGSYPEVVCLALLHALDLIGISELAETGCHD
jgi:hypothetical protein